MSFDYCPVDRHGFSACGDFQSDEEIERKEYEKYMREAENELIRNSQLVEKSIFKAENENILDRIILEAENNPRIELDLNKLKEESLKRLKEEKLRNDIIAVVAGHNNNSIIQNQAIKKLLFLNLEYMIYTYAKQEHLSYSYVHLAKQRNCLEVLLKGFLKKDVGYILTSNLTEEIDAFLEDIYLNNNLDIIYTLVGRIQNFIHTYTDKKNGVDASKRLNTTHMRNLLSTARLHLNIGYIKYKDTETLVYAIENSEKASAIEEASPSLTLSSSGIGYINKKKIRDLKTLLDYGYYNISSKIYDIANLDKNLPVEEFKSIVINIYCDLRYRKKQNKPRWIGEKYMYEWQE